MIAELSVEALREHENNPHRSSRNIREKLFISEASRADEFEAEIDSPYASEPVPREQVDDDDVEKPASPIHHDDEYALSTQDDMQFPSGESPVTSN